MSEIGEIVEDHPIRDIEVTFGFLAELHAKLSDIADSLDDDTFAIDMWGEDAAGVSGIITTQQFLAAGAAPIRTNYNGPYVIESILVTFGTSASTATLQLGPRNLQIPAGGLWNPQALHIQMDRDDNITLKLSAAGTCFLEIFGHVDRRQIETRNRK